MGFRAGAAILMKERAMSVNSSEQVKTVQKILETVEEQKLALERATSDFNRKKIEVENILKESKSSAEKAKLALEQSMIHLRTELTKLTPEIFHSCNDGCVNDVHNYVHNYKK
jgi:hypothetical protein